jgi:hypothetical protein
VVVRVVRARGLRYGLAHTFAFGDPFAVAIPIQTIPTHTTAAAMAPSDPDQQQQQEWEQQQRWRRQQHAPGEWHEAACHPSESRRTHTAMGGSTHPVWLTGALAPFAHLVLALDYSRLV